MKNVFLAVLLTLSVRAFGQTTVSVTCTSPGTCGPVTLQSNTIAASGSGAGGLSMTANAVPPSVPGSGLASSSIAIFAPSTVQTPYGIALYPTTATSTPPSSGFWLGTLGTGATFCTTTLSGGSVNGFTSPCTTGVTGGGSGYASPPPCYLSVPSGDPQPTTPGTCTFTLTGTAISQVNIISGGVGYNASYAPSVNAAPTLFQSYIPSMYTGTSSYKVQVTTTAAPTGGDFPSFNSSGSGGDLVDSTYSPSSFAQVGVANTFTMSNTFTTVNATTLAATTINGAALNGTFTGNPTLSGNPSFTGTPTFSNALAMPSGTTGTTQTAGDTSTKLATDAFVNNIFAAPPAVGSTTAAAGSFTTLKTTAGLNDTTIGVTTANMVGQSSTTCTNITNMTWSISLSKNYRLRCDIPIQFTSGASVAFCLSGPGSAATSYSLTADGPIGTSAAYAQISTLAQTSWGTATATSSTQGAVSGVVHVYAEVQNGGTSGTLTLQTAANGSHAMEVLANASCQLIQEN